MFILLSIFLLPRQEKLIISARRQKTHFLLIFLHFKPLCRSLYSRIHRNLERKSISTPLFINRCFIYKPTDLTILLESNGESLENNYIYSRSQPCWSLRVQYFSSCFKAFGCCLSREVSNRTAEILANWNSSWSFAGIDLTRQQNMLENKVRERESEVRCVVWNGIIYISNHGTFICHHLLVEHRRSLAQLCTA